MPPTHPSGRSHGSWTIFRLWTLNGQARRREEISFAREHPAACGNAVKNSLSLASPRPSIFLGIAVFSPIPAAMPLFYIHPSALVLYSAMQASRYNLSSGLAVMGG